MPKFKMKFEITGFKLEVEGERAEVSHIAQNVGQQFAQLMQPASNIAEGSKWDGSEPPIDVPVAEDRVSSTKTKRTRKLAPAKVVQNGALQPLEFRNNPEKYGSPNQQWASADKCIWLLYVAEQALDVKQLSAKVIELTFQKHFREALAPTNIKRDLSARKSGKGQLVGEDTTKEPPEWYLTTAGKQHAQQLIAKALDRS